MICECGESSKYKCPTCRQPYCSVSCCQKHKESPCAPPTQAHTSIEQLTEKAHDYPTEDTVSNEKLKLLGNSTELKKCLQNPHVRTILETLNNSPHPDDLMQEYMQEPIFTEFVDECLKVVQAEDIFLL